jgi:tryptophanyl-tRNA synthetase
MRDSFPVITLLFEDKNTGKKKVTSMRTQMQNKERQRDLIGEPAFR